ncbi:helix-turn-helix domain-containing protein [Aurantiacibacter suaedae]|uniref:helix-turn-helix domain-containing protein n=1 Tax=Aurantiacibacter suaedae TaxID=2545755 RepID=UPI0010F61A20|nr:helix-turn-helix transcriptional regulator [Aurantiacibacter suaedae]
MVSFTLDVRFFRLSDALAPYFTALYSFALTCEDGGLVADSLHPEWAAMRFTYAGTPPAARIIPAEMQQCPPFVVSGPTSRAIDFRLSTSRIFGLGLQPAGWARFVDQPAASLKNVIADGGECGFGVFAPLLQLIEAAGGQEDAAAEAINGFLLDLDARTPSVPSRVLACQEALKDADLSDVDDLAERVGTSRRSLERLCSEYFGFPPKTLLRRQRFLRSLARFMLEPRGSWSEALDRHYYDQPHFVRDFRSIMGMTPSEYAEMPHPVLDRIIAQRMVDQGAVAQTDLPTILRYGGGKAPRSVEKAK